MSEDKGKSSISKASSYREIGDFWDTHDVADYWEQTEPVEFEVNLQSESTHLEHSKYDHVFAVIRIDTFQDEAPLKDKIMVTKIALTEEAAEREVKRLNELNSSKGALYFWQVTRIERPTEKPAKEYSI